MRVKFCGLTRFEDARLGADLGAWALGFIFYDRSPRCVTPEQVARIVERLPSGPLPVGVFVNAKPEHIEQVARTAGLGLVQLHGDESPEWIDQLSVPVMRAFRPSGVLDLEAFRVWDRAQAWLVDAAVPGSYGGTGARADWQMARELTRVAPRLVLAGGLTPENVMEAVQQVGPFAVDVSSGVEVSPGIKDPQKMRDFACNANGEVKESES